MKKSTLIIIVIVLIVMGALFAVQTGELNTELLTGRLNYEFEDTRLNTNTYFINTDKDNELQIETEGKTHNQILVEINRGASLREAIRLTNSEEGPFEKDKIIKFAVTAKKTVLREPIILQNGHVEGLIIDGGTRNKATITCVDRTFPAFKILPSGKVAPVLRGEQRERVVRERVPHNIKLRNLTIEGCGQVLDMEPHSEEVVTNNSRQVVQTAAYTGEIVLEKNVIQNNGYSGPVINIYPREYTDNPTWPTVEGGTLVISDNIFKNNISSAIAAIETSVGYSYEYPVYISDNTFETNGSQEKKEETAVIRIHETALEKTTGITCTGRRENRKCSGTSRRSALGGFEINDNSFINNKSFAISMRDGEGAPGIYYTNDTQIKNNPTPFINYVSSNYNEHLAFAEDVLNRSNPFSVEQGENGKIKVIIRNILIHRTKKDEDNVLGNYHSDIGKNGVVTVLQGTAPNMLTTFLGEFSAIEANINLTNIEPKNGGYFGFIAYVKDDRNIINGTRYALSSDILIQEIIPTTIEEVQLNPANIYPFSLTHAEALATQTVIKIRNKQNVSPETRYKVLLRTKFKDSPHGEFQLLPDTELGNNIAAGEEVTWRSTTNGTPVSPSEIDILDTDDKYFEFQYLIVAQRIESEVVMEEKEKEIVVLPGVRPQDPTGLVDLSSSQLLIEHERLDPVAECIRLPNSGRLTIEFPIFGSEAYEDSYYIVKASKKGEDGEIHIDKGRYGVGDYRFDWCGTGFIRNNEQAAQVVEGKDLQAALFQIQEPGATVQGRQIDVDQIKDLNVADPNLDNRNNIIQNNDLLTKPLTVAAGEYEVWVERYTRKDGRKLETSKKKDLTIRRLDLEENVTQEEIDQARADAETARRDAEAARREAAEARRAADQVQENLDNLLDELATEFCTAIIDDIYTEELFNICKQSYLAN